MTNAEILLETGTNELEILEFYINEAGSGPDTPAYFGINVAKVMQVIESPQLTPPDSAPHPSFLGNIPLRGHILPVLDLSVWLNMESRPSPHDIVIVTEFSQAVTGFLVSGVTEIHRVGWQEVIPPSGYIQAVGPGSIVGLVDRDGHFIQLLDLETILSEFTRKPSDDDAAVRSEKRYTALVADDSATIRMMLEDSLSRANFRPIMATTGQEALKMLRGMQEQARTEGGGDRVDIVISDIEMPLMDGFSLTKNIKEDPGLRDLPVILYSSIITDELRHKGEAVRADAQISKPDMDRIPAVAINLIEGRRA